MSKTAVDLQSHCRLSKDKVELTVKVIYDNDEDLKHPLSCDEVLKQVALVCVTQLENMEAENESANQDMQSGQTPGSPSDISG